MKKQTKWAVRVIVRYGAIWGCSYMISIIVILMTEDILQTQGVAISRFLDSTIYIVDILIFALIATKLEKRIKFYLQFGFAPGKSEKKQIATWKKIKELSLPIKDQLFFRCYQSFKIIPVDH